MDSIKSSDDVREQKMARVEVKEANEIIGKQYRVLDKGFITLVDYMGNDSSVVQAARVSYGTGTKSVRDDSGLLRYLMRHEHTTPFEMVEFKFLARMPIFVARQWVRHRTASINEYSARYSLVKDDYYVPDTSQIQAQSTTNRQGREYGLLTSEVQVGIAKDIRDFSDKAYALYSDLISRGTARELARMVLPLNFYTEWYWKSNLHNVFHFLALRLDAHAQWEIRQYAAKMGEIVKTVVPVAYKAFEDFTLNAARLSEKEQVAISKMLSGSTLSDACAFAGLELLRADGKPVKSGEGPEFVEKLDRINARASGFGK